MDYKSNSHKSKEVKTDTVPEKKLAKVISGNAKPKKKSEVRKFTDVFISEDVDSVKSYILLDVLVPAVKKAISDIVTNGIDMILYGESGGNTVKKSTASKVSYRSYYDSGNDRRSQTTTRSSFGYDYDDIVLDNKGEAVMVLERMEEVLSMYGTVSVSDLYELVGISGSYTDNNYGWADLHSASVVRVRDGYKLRMPKVMPLD